MIPKRNLVTLAILVLAASHGAVATEEIGWHGWGVRAGITDDVNQVVGGAHFNLGEVTTNLRLQPDVQLGVGDDATTLYGTAPLYYRFPGNKVTPYGGGGLTLGYVDADPPPGSSNNGGLEFGARATGGVEWSRGGTEAFFLELSLGFGDVHDATLMAAWSF